MSTAAAVLPHNAELLLDGTMATTPPSARLSAFLARQALEDLVTQRCKALDAEMRGTTAASKLVVLRALDDPEIAASATTAWNGLSSACHHHAYELSPTNDEVRHLCRLVADLLAR